VAALLLLPINVVSYLMFFFVFAALLMASWEIVV